MTNSHRLITTLKRELKARAMTYRQLARRLDLSESAVKHMFSTGNFSLKRLDEICAALGIDLGELVSLSEAQEPRIEELPVAFEHEIVSDIRFLLVTYCLLNHWTFEEIIARYEISRREGFGYLRRLDQMRIIELLPGERVRLLVASHFKWRPNGPIERFFDQRVQTEFFRHGFSAPGALRIVKNGMLSAKAQARLRERLETLGALFDDASWEERKLPVSEQNGTTLVLAMRHWTFEGFRALERSPDGPLRPGPRAAPRG